MCLGECIDPSTLIVLGSGGSVVKALGECSEGYEFKSQPFLAVTVGSLSKTINLQLLSCKFGWKHQPNEQMLCHSRDLARVFGLVLNKLEKNWVKLKRRVTSPLNHS